MILREVNKEAGKILGEQILKNYDFIREEVKIIYIGILWNYSNFRIIYFSILMTWGPTILSNLWLITSTLLWFQNFYARWRIWCKSSEFIQNFIIFYFSQYKIKDNSLKIRKKRGLRMANTQKYTIIHNLAAWKVSSDSKDRNNPPIF